MRKKNADSGLEKKLRKISFLKYNELFTSGNIKYSNFNYIPIPRLH